MCQHENFIRVLIHLIENKIYNSTWNFGNQFAVDENLIFNGQLFNGNIMDEKIIMFATVKINVQ